MKRGGNANMETKEECFCIENLVSIIMPAYNCEDFIAETIESVEKQTYQEWELLIVDDCSTDKTRDIVEAYRKKDERIILYKNGNNRGAAYSRNRAVKYAKGEFIAFLDSDDLWEKNKLEIQISFMKKNSCPFSCTYYKKIDETGNETGEIVKSKKELKYKDLLKNCPGNSTVVYNAKELGKFYIPNIKKRNDYVMWLNVIKKAKKVYTLNSCLGCHRIRGGSLSKRKVDLIQYHWIVYRKFEKLNIFYSCYLLLYWCLKGIGRNLINIKMRIKNNENITYKL